jgi:hypothetical protein
MKQDFPRDLRLLVIGLILVLIPAVLVRPPTGWAQQGGPAESASPLEGPFTLWMMTHEGRAMTLLHTDRELVRRLSSPFGLLPSLPVPGLRADSQQFQANLKLYRILAEVGVIFRLLRTLGGGSIISTINQVQPGIWSSIPIAIHPLMARTLVLAPLITRQFRDDLLSVFGVDPERDANLGARLESTLRSLGDAELRQLNAYMEAFRALYPSEPATKALQALITGGLKKSQSQALAGLIRPGTGGESGTSGSETAAEAEPDPLAELTALDDSNSVTSPGSGPSSASPTSDPFDIW